MDLNHPNSVSKRVKNLLSSNLLLRYTLQDAVQRLEGEVKKLEQKLLDNDTNADTISRDNNLLKRKLDSLQASENSKRKNEALKLGTYGDCPEINKQTYL